MKAVFRKCVASLNDAFIDTLSDDFASHLRRYRDSDREHIAEGYVEACVAFAEASFALDEPVSIRSCDARFELARIDFRAAREAWLEMTSEAEK